MGTGEDKQEVGGVNRRQCFRWIKKAEQVELARL